MMCLKCKSNNVVLEKKPPVLDLSKSNKLVVKREDNIEHYLCIDCGNKFAYIRV